MREVLEGSQGVARAVALCRPAVVCAYPISPQTHIVEALARLVSSEQLTRCEFLTVESEFSAMSVAIGASAAGGRVYTATASQGLLYMAEVVYNAAGLGLPIVMTVANRAVGAPINIWNDHSDAMALRGAGWLQLYAMDNQEALDLHVIAFAVAEELRIPVMVCMDGFVLTHASDVLEVPTQEQVDTFLPPYAPQVRLDPDHPRTFGTMAGPETFTETKYLQHLRMLDAIEVVARWVDRYREVTGREAGEPVTRFDPTTLERDRNAAPVGAGEIAVVAMGSVLGTLQAGLAPLVADGVGVRLVGVSSFRPFPAAALREALGQAERVVVIDRSLELGNEGDLSAEVRRTLGDDGPPVHSVLAGLGGRPVLESLLAEAVAQARAGTLGALTFLDLRPESLPFAGPHATGAPAEVAP